MADQTFEKLARRYIEQRRATSSQPGLASFEFEDNPYAYGHGRMLSQPEMQHFAQDPLYATAPVETTVPIDENYLGIVERQSFNRIDPNSTPSPYGPRNVMQFQAAELNPHYAIMDPSVLDEMNRYADVGSAEEGFDFSSYYNQAPDMTDFAHENYVAAQIGPEAATLGSKPTAEGPGATPYNPQYIAAQMWSPDADGSWPKQRRKQEQLLRQAQAMQALANR